MKTQQCILFEVCAARFKDNLLNLASSVLRTQLFCATLESLVHDPFATLMSSQSLDTQEAFVMLEYS